MAIEGPDIFDNLQIDPELDALLRDTNPWWEGKPGRVIPPFRRWAFAPLLKRLEGGLAPAVVLKGARQVGKTTLQEQVIRHLLDEKGVEPKRILRLQFDEIQGFRTLKDPILTIARWFENRVLGETFNQAAHAGKPAYLFLDEVQNLRDWAPQVKSLVDHHSLRAVITGSSSLRIEAGRDSLAGRITTIELGTLLLREIAGLHFGETIDPLLSENGPGPLLDRSLWEGLRHHGEANRESRDRAFRAFSDRGGYPLVHINPDLDWPDVAEQLNETVVRRVIQHDLRMGERGARRDEALLREVFRLACTYADQAPGRATLVREIQLRHSSDVGWQRILKYLRFLDGALLIKLIRPLEIRLKKQQASTKICVLDHGIRASWLGEVIPLDPERLSELPHLMDLAGHIAESDVGAFLGGLPSLDLTYFPERPTEPEVDYVLTIGERRIPLEVKYRRRIDPLRDTIGLRSFLEKAHYNAPFGILVTQDDDVEIPDPRIIPVSLRSLLLLR